MRLSKILWTGLLVCTLITSAAGSTLRKTLYVDDDAPGFGVGSSWESAYRYLQDALAEAEAAEGPVEIRVAQGLYRPDRSSAHPGGTRKREATFHLVDGATIRGGYAGLGAADPDTRDAALHRTVLSGDLAGDDAEHANPLDARADPTRADNSFHVVSFNEWHIREVDLSAELEGLVITGGYAFLFKSTGRVPTYMSPTRHFGAGLYVRGGGDGTTAEVVIRDCVFERNYAEEIGGALYCRNVTQFTLADCRFTENGTYKFGGAMLTSASTIRLDGCRLTRNVAGGDGGAIVCWGASSMTAEGCELEGNKGTNGGALKIEESSVVQVSQCILRGNLGRSGGAVYLVGFSFSAESSLFTANKSQKTGGAVFSLGGDSINLSQCLFSGNSAGEGGAVLRSQSGERQRLINCTAVGNRAPKGAFLFEETRTDGFGYTEVVNCVISNGGSEIDNDKGDVVIRHTNLPMGQETVRDPSGRVILGPGNTESDPLFADAGRWDPNGTPDDPHDDFWVDGDYHLKSQAGRWDPATDSWVADDMTSPCIDAGDPNSPIGPEPFPNGGRINLGAYGGTTEASKSYFGEPPCETIVAGDINGDCRVDWKDLGIMGLHWLERHGP